MLKLLVCAAWSPGQAGMAKVAFLHPLIEIHRTDLLALAGRRGVTEVRILA